MPPLSMGVPWHSMGDGTVTSDGCARCAPVVVLATGVTAAARVLPVLADAAMARRHVAALLAVGLEACAAATGRRQRRRAMGGRHRSAVCPRASRSRHHTLLLLPVCAKGPPRLHSLHGRGARLPARRLGLLAGAWLPQHPWGSTRAPRCPVCHTLLHRNMQASTHGSSSCRPSS